MFWGCEGPREPIRTGAPRHEGLQGLIHIGALGREGPNSHELMQIGAMGREGPMGSILRAG